MRSDIRASAVASSPPPSHTVTHTRENASPIFVAKIMRPANAASVPQARTSRRNSSAAAVPRCDS